MAASKRSARSRLAPGRQEKAGGRAGDKLRHAAGRDQRKDLAVTYRDVADLIPYASNARTHSEAQVAQIAASISEFSFTNPILLDGDSGIIAGHGRVLAARKLGLDRVPCIDLAHLSPSQRRAYVIADNKLALNAGWDLDLLKAELDAIKESDVALALVGFDDAELQALYAPAANAGLTDPDAVPAPAHPVSRPGDLWLLGRHRLLCGDCTVETDVAKVLAGAKPHLMVTDPPYGVELDMEWRDRAGHNSMAPASRSYMKQAMGGKGMSGDTIGDWSPAFALVPSINIAYVWHATSKLIEVGRGLEALGFDLRQQIIWVKTVAAMSRQAYHWKHEPCWYAVRKGKTAKWIGSHDQTTLWEAASPKHIMSGSKEDKFDHPTQKPIVLIERAIANHDSPDVYEPFDGSGTALIACERLGRRCFATEVEPRFVDVAVRRWQQFTGASATLESDGRAFDEIEKERKHD